MTDKNLIDPYIELSYPNAKEKIEVSTDEDDSPLKPPSPFLPSYEGNVDLPIPPRQSAVPSHADVDAISKKLEALQIQLQRFKDTTKTDAKDVQAVKPLESVQFYMNSPFVILPQMEGVLNPLKAGKPGIGKVTVGSVQWLRVLDELRASGWHWGNGDMGIEAFLLESAWIVKQALNYDVLWGPIEGDNQRRPINFDKYADVNVQKKYGTSNPQIAFKKDMLASKGEYINNIEKFVMWYPDASRQEERLEKGYIKLITDIKSTLGTTAFFPENYDSADSSQMKCPPRSQDFMLGNIPVKNFLRHWTVYDRTKEGVTYIRVGDGLKLVYQCTYPKNLKFAWIPIEYRKEIEELYGLIQFRYTRTDDFKKYMYTLLSRTDSDDAIRHMENGKRYITVQSENNEGFKMGLARVDLSFDSHAKREGVSEGDLTLREWIIEWSTNVSYYPLLHVILNAEVPKNVPVAKSNIYYVNYRGKTLKRMYADASVKAFKQGLIDQHLGTPRPGEDYNNCLERFIKNVYNTILKKSLFSNLPQVVPNRYREILTDLFEMGGRPKECDITSITKIQSSSSGSPEFEPIRYTDKEIDDLDAKDFKDRIADLMKIIRQLA